MSLSKNVLNSILAGAVVAAAAGAVLAPTEAEAKKGEKEKCYGVVKAGENDCGNHAGTHSCAAQSTVDGDTGEWVYVPKGLCDKLVNGSLTGA